MLIFQIAVGSFIGVSAAVGFIMGIEAGVEHFKNKKDADLCRILLSERL